MQRKVIKLGPSTLTVSLPSKWVRENDVKKDSAVEMEIDDNKLVISTNKLSGKKSAKIHVPSKNDFMKRLVFSKYRQGYDEIIFTYDDSAVFQLIKKSLQYVPGFEIVDQAHKSCTIRNITEAVDDNYEAVLRRMFHIIITMAETMLDYSKKKNKDLLQIVQELRESVIRLSELNLRTIYKTQTISVEQKSIEFFYSWNLGVLGKLWSYIAQDILGKNKIQLSKNDSAFIKSVADYTKDLNSFYFKKDQQLLVKMRAKRYSLREDGLKLLDVTKNKSIVFYLLSIVEKIYDMSIAFE